MVVLLMGYPASGKSSVAREYEDKGFIILNRDKAGGKVASLVPHLRQLLKAGEDVLLDNTFPTAESRKPFIEATKAAGEEIRCIWLTTSIEQAQFNACTRMIRKHGKLLSLDEIKRENNPNTYPPVVLFKYRKEFEDPTTGEGFDQITMQAFVRKPDPDYNKSAIIFDFDGTLRETKSGKIFPTHPEDIRLLPGRKEKLKQLRKKGKRLLGASNQSGIAKGDVSDVVARTCFLATLTQLGVDIDFQYCPHRVPPVSCWCRKPMTGMGVHFIEKYKLDPAKVTMVGDMTSDKTFAARCGFQYVDAEDFFA